MRDAQATRRRLVRAVGRVLSTKGFAGLGVNALAREAGVDKVLIYRYFDGLPGLIRTFGREGDFWPSNEELMGCRLEEFALLPLEKRLQRLTVNFLHALRQRPLTLEIMAWELVERNELTEELEQVREQSILSILEQGFPERSSLPDLEAMAAIVGAATSYLVVRSRRIRWYTGVDLQSESGWKRLETAFCRMISGVVPG